MAQKRMFDKSVTNNDLFLEMPDSTQNLYFHLNMEADDDGFVDNWKSVMKMTGKKDDDLKLLIAKKFIIPFESGVIVIKHWRINNYLRKDRYHQTKYLKEKNQLSIEENEEYSLNNYAGIPLGNREENRIEENNISTTPTIEQNIEQFLRGDLEEEPLVDNLYSFLEHAWGRSLSPFEYELLGKWEDNEITRYAIKESVKCNARSIKYVERIVDNLKAKGIQTEAEAIIESDNFKLSRKHKIKTYSNSGDKLEKLEEKIKGEIHE